LSFFSANIEYGVEATQSAIWGTFFHVISTDEEPHHFRCPEGTDSWCWYQAALANGEEPGSHEDHQSTSYLSLDVAERLIPVYRRMSEPRLLERLLHGGTQNQNESLNSQIWLRYYSSCKCTTR